MAIDAVSRSSGTHFRTCTEASRAGYGRTNSGEPGYAVTSTGAATELLANGGDPSSSRPTPWRRLRSSGRASSQDAPRGRQICALQHPTARNGLCNRSLVLTPARNVPQVSDRKLNRKKQVYVWVIVGSGECDDFAHQATSSGQVWRRCHQSVSFELMAERPRSAISWSDSTGLLVHLGGRCSCPKAPSGSSREGPSR